MIVNNLPAIGKLAKNQRKQSLRRLAVGHSQLPSATYKGSDLTQDLDAQAGEFEFSHFVPGASIGSEITLHRCLPSVMLFCSREKSEVRRIPVPCHEAFQVVLVPGFLLLMQHALDGSGFGTIFALVDLRIGLMARCNQKPREP